MVSSRILTVCWALGLGCLLAPGAQAVPATRRESSCRYLPGDQEWPSGAEWAKLNTTVGGRLIATVPLGSPCHDPNYNATECAYLAAQWSYPEIHANSSSSFSNPFFQNRSCDPFTGESSACRIGNYYDYAINVTSAADVAAGLAFAQKKNIRLVIKNTGHDLLGRSSGKGGLGLWTHHLKSISVLDYNSPSYTGKAMRMGAGVQGFDAYLAAHQAGLRVVGGTCSTVGLTGGYTQGGGHSMLSTLYGLSADQVLEWEVVLTNGTHARATPTNYPDLYWALSGGGGGTYAVVLSMTVKAHADSPVTGALMTVTKTTSEDAFWEAVTAFHAAMPSWIEKGAATAYYIADGALYLIPATFANYSSSEVTGFMQPFVAQLQQLSVNYTLTVTTFDNYYSFFDNYFGPLPYGTYTNAQVQGGRLIPRTVLASNSSNAALTSALREIASNPAFHIVGVGADVSRAAHVPNAVFPGWRKAITWIEIAANWDWNQAYATNAANETLITQKYDPLLAAVTGPESGAYLNEGDFAQRDFQTQFFGSNYATLKAIKNKYDPGHIFYGNALVGSDDWTVASDGRLCRA
ncbi:FAD-binding domain-containing protein [Aspergillus sclerotiicarbonarius CBS 121057]|uniref:FAD-binding domain-containing protein n=1 Tax=Aspergillus sclerotiicarbonarius (strain CBS 121057 / IBT 28362) TaxID=1448318 RepID=A0A319EJU7_ASPSB|nr:FAD-binding domain-containing protein [Aspergillus sclerotiicarbonarius CBS 121057]